MNVILDGVVCFIGKQNLQSRDHLVASAFANRHIVDNDHSSFAAGSCVGLPSGDSFPTVFESALSNTTVARISHLVGCRSRRETWRPHFGMNPSLFLQSSEKFK
jgi:hypothetical protein